jgi:RNA 3'-terminal phosphate cyclase
VENGKSSEVTASLRSSLVLLLVTGRPVVIEKIRAGRKKPGLMRQHLTAVPAAAEVGGAEVEGAAVGSRRLVLRPGPVQAGDYIVRVGTAGNWRGIRALSLLPFLFVFLLPLLLFFFAPFRAFAVDALGTWHGSFSDLHVIVASVALSARYVTLVFDR